MNLVSGTPRVLVLGGLLLVACGGGSSPEDFSEAYEDYIESWEEALCQRQARCGEIRDVDACVSSRREYARAEHEARVSTYFQFEGSRRAGRLRFDAEAARDCVQLLRDSTCDESLSGVVLADVCEVLEGQQKDGESCHISEECGKASYCERTDEPVCKEGTCRPGLGMGQHVDDFQECAPGLLQVGDTCRALSEEGGPCSMDYMCMPGLYCQSGLGECRRLAAEGARCGDGVARCLGHLRCIEGSCQRMFDVGADCNPPETGPGGIRTTECKRDLFCAGGGGTRLGTCRELLGLGEPCSGDTCRRNLFCVRVDGTQDGSCQPMRQVGESCAGVPCVPGAYCDEGSEKCLAEGRMGEPCVSSDPFSCIPGLECRNGRCEAAFGGLCE